MLFAKGEITFDVEYKQKKTAAEEKKTFAVKNNFKNFAGCLGVRHLHRIRSYQRASRCLTPGAKFFKKSHKRLSTLLRRKKHCRMRK
jgi:hypothetical protein